MIVKLETIGNRSQKLPVFELRFLHVNMSFCFGKTFQSRLAEPPEDIKHVFNQYAKNGTMTIDSLRRFLIEYQEESNATIEDTQAIFNNFKHLNIFPRKGLGLHAFFRYLLSDLNPPLDSRVQVHHDMSAPLAHYFLFSSHNSYLTGHQVSSDSNVQPIIDALHEGVRVIELDLWLSSKKNSVEVRHGGNPTSQVELIKCLLAIKDNAFVVSEYPVVIMFEDHLPTDLKARVASMITETFGDMLYSPTSEFSMGFPSPESLKRRILISTKPPEYHEPRTPKESGATAHKVIEKIDEENAIPEFKQMIGIQARKTKSVIDMRLMSESKISFSLSEQELEKVAETNRIDILRFTQRNFLRIYPKRTAFSASNYDPMLGWTLGAQMVAFNMQILPILQSVHFQKGHGKHLWIMEGMFRANGGCGYVKKPDILLNADPNNEIFNPDKSLPVKTNLKVKVYMSEGWCSDCSRNHFKRYSPPDLFAKVGIAGVPQDTKMMITRAIENQWIPVWNEEFDFPLSVPELALLWVELNDNSGNHDFGGQTCLPLPDLRTGIRAVPLHNSKGQKYRSVRLLMRFELIHLDKDK